MRGFLKGNRRGHTRKSCSLRVRVVLFSLPFLFFMIPIYSAYAVPTHLDKSKLKNGCGGCHKGHGQKGTPLLTKEKDQSCLDCHGPSGGTLDIYSELMKPSRHPVLETSQYHVTGEELPERSATQPRHASCFDCHNAHKSEKGQTLKGLKGYNGRGAKVKQAQHENELCYNCHSDSLNNTQRNSNIALAFTPSNASFHPVETYGRTSFVPSLKGNITSSSLINCTDCHGNDNPRGPKGPHGSLYTPLLKFRYNRTPGPESRAGYELCYSCHDRSSILGDESFKAHKVHVSYNQVSCAQCHDSHSSSLNPSLINFDTTTVFPSTKGDLLFLAGSYGKPHCFLSCHVNGKAYEHKLNDKLLYCINTNCPQQW